jgi:predicted RNA-binding protein YlxR (DUF448 family)
VKKKVERTCVGCNTKKEKKELIRIVKSKEGKLDVDKTGKLPGRGAYLCDNPECLEKAKKSKRLERTLECQITDEIYEKIRGGWSDK